MKKFLFQTLSVLLACGIWSIAGTASAVKVSAQVVINELFPNPNTGENEWIELWNTGSAEMNLSEWALWDQLTTPSLVHSFPVTTLLGAREFLVIPLQNVLNNSGDGMTLKNATGQIIDTLTYSSSAKGKSWARDPADLTHIFETDPTPGTTNPPFTPIPTPTPSLSPTPENTNPVVLPILSEIMACPADSDEWVELANPHDTGIALGGFTLRDNKNQIFAFTNQTLEPLGFLVVELRNVLNNSGDSVSLISPAKTVIATMSYALCSADSSWIYHENTWQQTPFVTKGSANISATNETNPSEGNTSLPASGTQTSPSALLSTKHFWYPPSVLQPHLSLDEPIFSDAANIAFSDQPELEHGALSVIMGSLFLLVPGFVYVKNRRPFA